MPRSPLASRPNNPAFVIAIGEHPVNHLWRLSQRTVVVADKPVRRSVDV
jgi:hypothetical protein